MILATTGIISSISGVDADWLAYYNRVIAAGGSLTTTEQNATKTLVADLKANSLWTPMKAIYPMVGASAAACAQNLKSSSFTGSFSVGGTYSSNGYNGNSVAYMNTGFKQSDSALNSQHLSIYSRTNRDTAEVDMGMFGGSSNSYLAVKFNGVIYPTIQSAESSGGASPFTSTLGLIIGNKRDLLNSTFYQNGILLGTYVRASTALDNSLNFYLGAYNNSGSAALLSSKQYAFASIGDGLTDTQASNFYTAVQTFQTTLSRNV